MMHPSRSTARGARRLAFAAPIFGFSLLALLPGAAAAVTPTAPALPSGGVVAGGDATIRTFDSRVVIKQTSDKAIINWNDFSIGQGGTVQFNNGTGATLNRVTGDASSQIDGMLGATGSVYLINRNGVVIGASGVVKTGGSFVASTLDLQDESFNYNDFTYASPDYNHRSSVVNMGKISSSGGDVLLIGDSVYNQGSISSPNGLAGLATGVAMAFRDTGDENGRFVIYSSFHGASSNTGVIAAANVELHALGGNIYAMAGATPGVIRATGIRADGADGRIWISNVIGNTTVEGELTASNKTNTASIRVSDQTLTFDPATQVSAGVGGQFTIVHTANNQNSLFSPSSDELAVVQTALSHRTNVTEQAGSIVWDRAFSWTSAATLSLTAVGGYDPTYTNVLPGSLRLEAPITFSKGGLTLNSPQVQVNAGVTVTGPGTITVNNTYGDPNGLTFIQGSSFDFGAKDKGGLLVIDGYYYTLLYSMAQLDRLDGLDARNGQAVTAAPNGLAGAYALATNLDATGTTYAHGLLASDPNTPFTGLFEGAGHTITGLTISTTDSYAGLFGVTSGLIENVRLAGGSVSSTAGDGAAGALAGASGGFIYNATASTDVSHASNNAGGLVGESGGVMVNDSASGTVFGGFNAGGLIGNMVGTLASSHATGSVFSNYNAGGLVGQSANSSVSGSYATGNVWAINANTGGLIGLSRDDTLTSDYATGNVTVSNDQATAGGLVGKTAGSAISYVYALGDVTGGGFAGGLVGLVTYSNNDFSHIRQAYAGGRTSGSASFGGLFGDVNGASIDSAYYDSDVTAAGVSGSYYGADNVVTNVGGLTTAQSLIAKNYVGFNFTTTPGGEGWVIVGANGKLNTASGVTRPLLASEYSTTITNAHQLQLIAMNTAAAYELHGDVTVDTGPGDVWLNHGFTPVGATADGFTGSLNGRGYTISGLTIGGVAAPIGNAGLFSLIGAAGSVHDLKLTNATVFGGDNTGILAAKNAGLVNYVTVSGSVNGATNTGGMIGLNTGGSVVNSGSSASVTGSTRVGGLVGYMQGGLLENDRASGAVQGARQVGGLVGRNLALISTSSASGDVSGDDVVGGLIGYNGGAYVNSTASGAVTSPGKRKGPIVGQDVNPAVPPS